MTFPEHMEALSVKVPVSSSSFSPVSSPEAGREGAGQGGLEEESSTVDESRGLLSRAAAGFSEGDASVLSFHPLLGHDSLMSERDSQSQVRTGTM